MMLYIPDVGYLESISREVLLGVKSFTLFYQLIYLKSPKEFKRLEKIAATVEKFKEKSHQNYFIELCPEFATKLMNFKLDLV